MDKVIALAIFLVGFVVAYTVSRITTSAGVVTLAYILVIGISIGTVNKFCKKKKVN